MENDYEKFFTKAKKLKEEMELKRLRGLNDFNIFTTLLKENDEVRAHSKFIHALLDINGMHYQKELFLNHFIKSCGLEDFELCTNRTIAYREYENIDIYLTDGDKHIIIENKIYASDQEHQIKRYIEKIADENKNIKGDDIYVIYLSLDRDEPSDYSLENFILQNNNLTYKDDGKLRNLGKIKFKSIHYDKEILHWLDECLKDVSNLTNLNVLITQYKNTIELLYGTYKGVEMELHELIKANYDISSEIANKFSEAKKQIVSNFLDDVKINLDNTLEPKLKDYWEINQYEISFKRWEISFSITPKKHSEYYLYFVLEFDDENLNNPYLGLASSDEKLDPTQIKEKLNFLQKENCNTENGFLHWQWVRDDIDDFAKYISNNSLTIEAFSAMIVNLMKKFDDIAREVNENIQNYM